MNNNDFDTMLQSILHDAEKNLERSVRLLKVVHSLCEIPTNIRDEYIKQESGVIVYDEDGEVALVGTLGQVSVFLGITGNKQVKCNTKRYKNAIYTPTQCKYNC